MKIVRPASFRLAISRRQNLILGCVSLWLGFGSTVQALQTEFEPGNDMEQVVRQFSEDQKTLDHRFRVRLDASGQQEREQSIKNWLERLGAVEFSKLDRSAQLDYLLLRNKLEYLQEKLRLDFQRDQTATGEYLPFAQRLIEFCTHREDVDPISPANLAGQLNSVAAEVEKLADQPKPAGEIATEVRLRALRAVELLRSLKGSTTEADRFYEGYDPNYSWWCKMPVQRLTAALDRYATYLQDKIVGVPQSDVETIIGLPIGADGIALELKHEWIAHTPEELIKLAEREMEWCAAEMKKASDELGCENWHQALEKVKENHVQPGDQPAMIRRLAEEAIKYVRDHDLMTVPDLAARGWRMTMMSPERQRVNPYFLGGDTIIVSFPTDSMTHEEKLMSLRSNNEHFARATVHHELIPGHHMQYHMLARFRPYRDVFATPFWMEGWALYWEMLLWDRGFARGPEDRVGMLFWRKHRCARIIFSLNYHLGKMTPEQCIDYLVDNVGHERSAAAAEVRRSIMGNYGPLYQAAYMLGGLQIRKMHVELVESGKLTERQFHDAILKEHSIPIELLRNYLSGAAMSADARPSWRFAD